MTTEDNRVYNCDEGKVFIRKSDNFIMGPGIDLGEGDTIGNYSEIDDPNLETEEEEKEEEE